MEEANTKGNVPQLRRWGKIESTEQKKFYESLCAQLDAGEYVDVEGNYQYVWTYFKEWQKYYGDWCDYRDFPAENFTYQKVDEIDVDTCDFFIQLSDYYKDEPYLAMHIRDFSLQCLIYLGELAKYIKVSKTDIHSFNLEGYYTQDALSSDWRLHFQFLLGLEPNPLDIAESTIGFSAAKEGLPAAHKPLYFQCLEEVFSEFGEKHGGWRKVLRSFTGPDSCRKFIRMNMIITMDGNPEIRMLSYSALCRRGRYPDLFEQLKVNSLRRFRQKLGLPADKEPRWKSEALLFSLINISFPDLKVVQHGRPRWLGQQHFDIWIPKINVAIEYHGEQHFKPVSVFGGEEGFLQTVKRDERKRQLAKKYGIRLFEVTSEDDPQELISRLSEMI